MKFKTIFISIATVALLGACSSQPKDGTTASADTSKKICKYEKSTGSNVGKRVCRTAEQIEAERKASQELVKRQRHAATNSVN